MLFRSTKGSIYALIALGYKMVYGIIKLINFAHGEIYMIDAFTALIIGGVLQITIGLSPLTILPYRWPPQFSFPPATALQWKKLLINH